MPIIAWGGSTGLIVGLLAFGVYLLRKQRKFSIWNLVSWSFQCVGCVAKCRWGLSGEWEHFLYVGKIAFFGWFLHYGRDFPFTGVYLHVADQ
jgi:dolichyl-phosphate-mannose-protein mannosyltransferase